MANINLVTNPSFETNTTSWSATNASIARDLTVVTPSTGTASLKVTATAAAVVTLSYTVTGLTIGKNYTASFYGKIQALTTDFSIIPTITGVNAVASVPMRTGDGFVRRYMGFTATATSHTFVIKSETALAIGDIFWVDLVQINQDTLLPYFDGSYPYSSWSGTANASTSSNTAFASSLAGSVTTDEVVVVNGFCLNTLAWNITTKTGRGTLPSTRGDDFTFPGQTGRIFVPNKPLDSGQYNLSMFVLGAYPDGSMPQFNAMRVMLVKNVEQIIQSCYSQSAPVTLYSWQPNGAVRVTTGTLVGSSGMDMNLFMAGRRAELSLVFDILPGVWSDYTTTTLTGTAGTGWSNQTLTLTALAGGTAPIEDSVVTVSGPITNPIVSNAATGTTVKFTGTVPTGQNWVIDSGAWTTKLNGVSVLSTTTHTGHPRFVVIDPGTAFAAPNLTLSGSATGASTNLSVTAARKHLISS